MAYEIVRNLLANDASLMPKWQSADRGGSFHALFAGLIWRLCSGKPLPTELRRSGLGRDGMRSSRIRDHKHKTPVTCATRVLIKAGNNLLSRCSHYHGPQVLNGRVRNGNGCGHLGMVTGKTLCLVRSPWSVVHGRDQAW